jgi:hypothetical protein
MRPDTAYHGPILAGMPLFVYLAAGLMHPAYSVHWPLLIVGFGAMFVVPLGLEVLRRGGMGIKVPTLAFIAAWAAMGFSAWHGDSWLLPLPWLLVALWIAWQAVAALMRGPRSVERVVMLSGPVMLAVGGAWYFADRTGMEPFGFDFLIVRLTAAHFHFAGFALPIAAGLVLRHAPGQLMRVAAIGVVAGMPMVATGITLTRMGARVEVECGLALLFSVCVLGIGAGQAALAWKQRTQPLAARALLFVSGVCLTAGMILAILYALRPWFPLTSLHLPRMWAWHGSIQAFGFALCGMIGWLRWRPA